MTRTYTLKRRAEQQAETRRRIVEAAVDLHGSVGPALTTHQHGRRAGRRSAAYALCALSGRAEPVPRLLRAVRRSAIRCPMPSRGARSRTGASACAPALRAIYDWYERNADAGRLRAARRRASRAHPGDRRDALGAVHGGLSRGAGRGAEARQRAMLRLALSFFTWRTLVREGGLKPGAAVEAMVQAVDCAK